MQKTQRSRCDAPSAPERKLPVSLLAFRRGFLARLEDLRHIAGQPGSPAIVIALFLPRTACLSCCSPEHHRVPLDLHLLVTTFEARGLVGIVVRKFVGKKGTL